LSISSNGCIDSKLSLDYKVLKVSHDAATQRVLSIDPLNAAEIAAHFSCTLPETHVAVVEKRTRVPVSRVWVGESAGVTSLVKMTQMVDGHLEDFGLLQLSRALLLESSGNKPSQLHQTGVDPVTSPLLNDPATLLPGHDVSGVWARTLVVIVAHVGFGVT
jgi:hypothetical protein